MAGLLRQPVSQLQGAAVLTDLVADSFDLVELFIELQEELGVRFVQDDLRGVKTVGDLIRLAEARSSTAGRRHAAR